MMKGRHKYFLFYSHIDEQLQFASVQTSTANHLQIYIQQKSPNHAALVTGLKSL